MINSGRIGAIIIENSPVEFVLVGPSKNGEVIMAKSSTAKLDLIGYAMLNNKASNEVMMIPFRSKRRFNIINSMPLLRNDNYDNRKSIVRYCWRGRSSRYQDEDLKSLFNRYSVDIIQAYEDGDKDRMVLNLSPVIFLCQEIKLKEKRKELIFFLPVIVSIIAFIFILFYFTRIL